MLKATGGNFPEFLDPFAGGGTIPLEALRLGLKTIACCDLNPVAVIINKAMLELPARFKDRKPFHAEENLLDTYAGSSTFGLAQDISFYGKRLKALAYKKIGKLYPKADNLTVIAWIWARTVTCPNPACACHMPLVTSFALSKKRHKFLEPVFDGKNISYAVRDGESPRPGTVDRNGATCIRCGRHFKLDYVRAEARAGRLSDQLIAIVAKGKSGRVYLPANDFHAKAANVDKPEDFPDGEIAYNPAHMNTNTYGLDHFADLFTNRQLTALTTFQDLIDEAIADIDDEEYAAAIKTYLALVISKLADYQATNCTWIIANDQIAHTFVRQAIPMVWTYAEGNPFSNSSGSFDNMLELVVKAVRNLPAEIKGEAYQHDAATDYNLSDKMVSTDPPYYDNISYANLSDFFYVWLRRSLISVYPKLFRARSVPKAEEIVADPYRHGGKEKARNFFEERMRVALKRIYEAASDEYPTTIYYAFKQKDIGGESSGWETMLDAVIRAGFIIVMTWPMRTERAARTNAIETSSLMSSVVLVCRRRHSAEVCTLNRFERELLPALTAALAELQKAGIAAVDMAQAAIGAGMEVYSRYERVVRLSGEAVTVSDALKTINELLDKYLRDQGEYDAESIFYLRLYEEYQYGEIKFDVIDKMARARSISPEKYIGLRAEKGSWRLKTAEELAELKEAPCEWIMMELLAAEPENAKRAALALNFKGDLDAVKKLAYRVFQILDTKRQAAQSVRYNDLTEDWSAFKRILNRLQHEAKAEQIELDFGEGEAE